MLNSYGIEFAKKGYYEMDYQKTKKLLMGLHLILTHARSKDEVVKRIHPRF